ncbi:hypothetical protein DM02DRAFT_629873 [Periconia macrospinosa]|uniref:Uncharacterized protein n=1 Tax=Periconia macrospinosa TaxID=97972 RepID=A0A2V1DM20_9PLEO|nr:hypothetical protein DM02DRAFT_629873 [Periconia macrospinosa]
MLSRLKRRGPPPPIWIPGIKNERRETGEPQTPSPIRSSTPKKSPTPNISTNNSGFRGPSQTIHASFALPSTSPHLTTLTSHTTLEVSITSKPSSLPITVSFPPTKTTFVTVTQSVFSPKGKGEDSPKGKDEDSPRSTKTVFPSGMEPLQFGTVTGAPVRSTVGVLPSSTAALGVTAGANLLPPGAKAPLIIITVIASIGAILAVIIIFVRRKKKRSEDKRRATTYSYVQISAACKKSSEHQYLLRGESMTEDGAVGFGPSDTEARKQNREL